jgi:hypothetical protein
MLPSRVCGAGRSKYRLLESIIDRSGAEWKEVHSDARHTWLTDDLGGGFEQVIPIGTREGKAGSDDSARSVFNAAGFQMYLAKPFDAIDLIRAVAKLSDPQTSED